MAEYKHKALFLRKSKKGNHLYAFAGDFTLIMPIEEVQDLIDDKLEEEYVIVSVMEKDTRKAEKEMMEKGLYITVEEP